MQPTTTLEEVRSPSVWALDDIRPLVRLLRVRQWYKNLIVFVPLVFSGAVFHLEHWPAAVLAFAAFCLLASAMYCVNDVLDWRRDQDHPRKRNRPIASGQVGVVPALLLAAGLAFSGIVLLTFLDSLTLAIGGAWLGLQAAYNLLLKHLFLWDLLSIALGFVLRALAGTTAIAIGPPTTWLIVCTFLFAFYLGLAKRRHERTLVDNGEGNGGLRRVLAHYPVPFLDRTMQTATGLILVSYALYASLGTTPWMLLTLPFALYGVFRHNHLVHRTDVGDEAEMIFTDRPTLVNAGLWLIVVLAVLAGTPQALVGWIEGVE